MKAKYCLFLVCSHGWSLFGDARFESRFKDTYRDAEPVAMRGQTVLCISSKHESSCWPAGGPLVCRGLLTTNDHWQTGTSRWNWRLTVFAWFAFLLSAFLGSASLSGFTATLGRQLWWWGSRKPVCDRINYFFEYQSFFFTPHPPPQVAQKKNHIINMEHVLAKPFKHSADA